MHEVAGQLISAAVSGLVGGIITGVAAFAAIRVEMRYLRRDIDRAHARLDQWLEVCNVRKTTDGYQEAKRA